MATSEGLIGQVLQQTYRIERLIGEGGMGVVYEASHLRLPRRFAIKVLAASVADDAAALARFQREAQVTSALGHPHILEVIDFNATPDGAPYIIMELLDGEDLATRLLRVGRLSVAQVGAILRQTASALDAAHQQGVIHRDLKPHNLFLCRRGKRDDFVKVVDFGVSKVAGSRSKLTSTQALIGTPVYMSPEQAEQKSGEADHRTDIYSLGVVVFEALAGQPPFAADSIPQLLFKVAFHEAPLLRSLRPDVPACVDAAVQRALAKKPAARFSSATELWEAYTGGAARSTDAEVTQVADWVPPIEAADLDDGPQPAPAHDSGSIAHARTAIATASSGKRTTLTLGTGEMAVPTLHVGRAKRTALVVAGVLALAGLSAIGVMLLHSPRRQGAGAGTSAALVSAGTATQRASARPDAGVATDPDRSAAATVTASARPDAGTRQPQPDARPAVKQPVRPRPKLKTGPRPQATKPSAKKKKNRIGDDLVDFEESGKKTRKQR